MKPYYSEAGIEIYNCDCVDFEVGKYDLLLTDPPYGIGEAAGKNKSRVKNTGFKSSPKGSNRVVAASDFGDLSWDDEPIELELLNKFISRCTSSIVFGGNYYYMPPSSCWLVWDKDNGASDFADCELAWTNLKKAVRKFRWRWNGMLQEHAGRHKEKRTHPTQKPLALMKWCIAQAPVDCQIIIDPFMGSGTTLRAAKDEGKKCIGIEREEQYCEMAAKRLSQSVLDFG